MSVEILHRAIQKLKELTGPLAKIQEERPEKGKKTKAISLILQKDNFRQEYRVNLRAKIVPIDVQIIKEQLKDAKPYILVAEYISSNAKEFMRKEEIPYLDTSGNMYVNDNGGYIFIETGKNNRKQFRETNRAFGKAGLKVVFQFLIHPELLNKPYRLIADQSMVTIDTVGKTIQGLLREKYILKKKKKTYQYLDKQKLFKEWVTAFNKNLRPKLQQQAYQWLDKQQNWKDLELPKNTFWGEAIAAEQLHSMLISTPAIIYTDEIFHDLARKLKLIPNSEGPIVMYKQFWKVEENETMIHPILIYADLVHKGKPRYLEAANKIYQNHVKNKL